jgi:Peroxiredoxin
MLKKLLLSITILFVCETVFSQSLQFDIPAQKGKTMHLLAYKGTKRDTVFTGKVDEYGKIRINNTIGLSSGVVTLFIEPEVSFDFIYSDKENATLHSEGEYIYAQNTHWHNSPENDFVETRFSEQAIRREKQMFAERGINLYKEDEKLHKELQKEKETLLKQQAAFEQMLQSEAPNLFSARMMIAQNQMNEHIGRLQITSDTAEYRKIREYAIENLDLETAYRSGMWFSVINGMLEMYFHPSPFHEQFGADIVKFLKRIKSQEVFLALANDAATICNQYSWNIDENTLSEYLHQSGRITNPEGKLRQMLMLYKRQSGMSAPPIEGVNLQGKKHLVVFYESGCNNCDNEMRQLVGNYPVLQEKGYDVISIAADTDSVSYTNNSRNFPWSTKLCDFKSFEGENFVNYGIIGTPTMYVIDEKGIIQGRYARLVDTLIINN